MKKILVLFLFSLFIISYSCKKEDSQPTEIAWDTYGVPHIKASSLEELFFAQGWAQMHNHANKIVELYGASRGRGAEYWGA